MRILPLVVVLVFSVSLVFPSLHTARAASTPVTVLKVPAGVDREEYREKYMGLINELRVLIIKAHEANLIVPISVLGLVGQDTSHSTAFTLDLTEGDKGYEVVALQNFLIDKGYSIEGGASGTFNEATKIALAAYQTANGITPAAGYFGPKTRAQIRTLVHQ